MAENRDWPSNETIRNAADKLGAQVADDLKAFKKAYAYASMNATGHQFHVSHVGYSREVRKALDKLAERLDHIAADSICSKTKKDENNKLDPPPGLTARLNRLSANLNRLLTGDVWHPPLFTDSEYSEPFAADKSSGSRIPLCRGYDVTI